MNSDLWQAVILGIVQGLTEFLPVSSTGHLILVPALLGWRGGVVDQLSFDVALHIGTLIALLIVFWRDWMRLIAAGIRSLLTRSLVDPDARLAWLIVLATIPGAVAGILLQRQIETVLRTPLVVGAMMVLVALVLAAIDRLADRRREEYSLGPVAALAIGLGQALALVPGVSRSGATMGVGLLAGLTREAAARFSFLMSTPIILGAVLKESVDVARHGLPPGEIAAFLAGIVAAGVTGYACVRWLLAYLRRRSLMPFVVYRLVAGTIVIGLALSGNLA
ncbi:MAG: undecaprenyl-diphosphatase UppP [Chloroflexi bacterium]|nr:undecaprenyl-diphosphatase UppP [Chloroflexota bacterium]